MTPWGRRPNGDTPFAASPSRVASGTSLQWWTPSVTTGARTPRGRRPNGDTPAAASPSRVDLGVSPHWRYALRHDGHHDAVGASPH